jgi:hypothetical protein
MGSVLEDLRAALEEASRTPRGKLAVEGHDEDFQVEIEGQEPIHVEFAGGKMAVRQGPSPRQDPIHFTIVQMDEGTLRAILGGSISPVEAMEQGRLFLRTRLYGGALLTILLRCAYDRAREDALAKVGTT